MQARHCFSRARHGIFAIIDDAGEIQEHTFDHPITMTRRDNGSSSSDIAGCNLPEDRMRDPIDHHLCAVSSVDHPESVTIDTVTLPGRLRGHGAGKCGCDNGLHSRKDRAHQFRRRISAQSDRQSEARGVFARAGVDGADALPGVFH